ncbi:hypothetical protein EX30DRAFT_112519 [Ascodesmis nigricans]|uniref:Uncharacterized protein n=1 Tax=Ascodesmis nigricans TaxID=341454 RepID=A0A4S2MSU3_9PEZI|nr:hypothetical protein EX30DRAFT_112519 [Ascodesmis nigricans]
MVLIDLLAYRRYVCSFSCLLFFLPSSSDAVSSFLVFLRLRLFYTSTGFFSLLFWLFILLLVGIHIHILPNFNFIFHPALHGSELRS